LAYSHITFHELGGHGIQNAFAMAAPAGPNPFSKPDRPLAPFYQHLGETTFDSGVSQPMLGLDKVSPAHRVVESERLSEGIAVTLLMREIAQLPGIDEDPALLAEAERLIREEWNDAGYRAARAVIDEGISGYPDLRARMKKAGTTVNYIGYANAHDRPTVDRILALTP